ncbi:sporulation peptidase YabG [Anaerobacillus alkalidiazotrophicus]|uniref:Sporulation peptidase YabG n=1 Tax=Anaerobacillus alkalidiazotrophicus TaxID=472963 RepID=A0A1S2M7R3_9BACI|nr:sporulation peptidase YabG [Anaerobacillus alkalidiazotrophicus]OIJ20533.1 sporulation peptidase YabG [Anaerobacillus alkalidiazotrophicus]
MKFKVGDFVLRKSYDYDILFRIYQIDNDKTVTIVGEEMRLIADAPINDLVLVNEQDRKLRNEEEKKKQESCYRLFRQDSRLLRQKSEYVMTGGYRSNSSYFELPGRILHIDGDPVYLNKCTDLYEKLGVPIYGVHMEEREIPLQITSLLEMVRPDILVVTGHDAYMRSKGDQNEMKAYRNTKYFAEAVREARKFEPHIDHLVIFAGACQSYFETLIRAGANFASSPDRINIHALDPVYIAAKVSLTSFMDSVSVWELLRNTLTGEKGLGGIETRGLLRRGMPTKSDEDINNDRKIGK